MVQSKSKSLSEFVNSKLGSVGPGNCLVGPYRPMGMVRLGPDSFFPNQTNGYQPGQSIAGFSHTHVSGTGGSSRYGNVRLMPFTGNAKIHPMAPFLSLPIHDRGATLPKNEISKVGYYSAEFEKFSTKVELTCTRQVGLHRYTFQNQDSRNVLLDAGAVIQTRGAPQGEVSPVEEWDSVATSAGGYLMKENDYELSGRSDFIGGWGHHQPYSIYFWIRSKQPFQEVKMAHKNGLIPSGAESFSLGAGCRAVLAYSEEFQVVELEIGISFVSVANARNSIAREVGKKSFEVICKECEEEWNQWFNRFQIVGGSDDDKTIFYSLLYRLLCMPTDLGIDSENPFWKSGNRHFTDFYCLWDSVRNTNSLYHLFAPELSSLLLSSLLDIADHTGWLPDAHIAGRHAYMQSGCACDILYYEAAAKGIKGIDYSKALTYLVKNSDEKSPDPMTKGRMLDVYHQKGFVSTDMPKSCVSRHIEYAYYDKCVAKLAQLLGDNKTNSRFEESSKRIWNLWRDDKKSFWPKNSDGTWLKENLVNTAESFPDSWNDPYCYEGTIDIWTMNVMFDFPELIKRFGGNEAFVNHLDDMFARGQTVVQETRMHVPHLYTYAGRPDKTAETIHKCLRNHFSNSSDGLKDNEDMGCQSSFFIFNTMGIYPIYGQLIYLLTPPYFNEINMSYGETGNSLKIISNRETSDLCYIESVKLNNKPLTKAWIHHDDISNGGVLEFKLSKSPTSWGKENLPPKF